MRALIHTQKSDVLVINATRTEAVDTLQTAWPGAGLDWIPAVRPGGTATPRAGVAMLICPGAPYFVAHV